MFFENDNIDVVITRPLAIIGVLEGRSYVFFIRCFVAHSLMANEIKYKNSLFKSIRKLVGILWKLTKKNKE